MLLQQLQWVDRDSAHELLDDVAVQAVEVDSYWIWVDVPLSLRLYCDSFYGSLYLYCSDVVVHFHGSPYRRRHHHHHCRQTHVFPLLPVPFGMDSPPRKLCCLYSWWPEVVSFLDDDDSPPSHGLPEEYSILWNSDHPDSAVV